jgi:integrase
LGKRRVDHIDAPAIQEVLLPIWLTVPETARRVRQRVGAVLDYSHAMEWRPLEAPMRAVARGLPKQPKKDGHFSAIPYRMLAELMDKVRAGDTSVGRLALQFTILTAARSGETRGARWGEFDLDAAVWTIPANRMKGEQAHSVPLSAPALAILQEVRGLFGGGKKELVFPGLAGKPISDATMSKALRVAGGGEYTVHGMRSAFRDWVAEATTFPAEWAEAALAHALPNRVEAAYRRTKFLDQRRGMMDAWAAFLAGPSNVIPLRGSASS